MSSTAIATVPKDQTVNQAALTVFENARKNGSLVFFDKNNFPQVELYRVEATEIEIDKDKHCFKINGKYMPKREMVDRIGEANGIIFTQGETKTVTVNDSAAGRRMVYVGSAQGKVRMGDGTWRHSSISHYEFDPTLRAMLDFKITELTPEAKNKRRLKDGKEYGNTLAEAILEYQKTGRQRANTGARLRVIRELVTMPIAFNEDEIKKPVTFGRIVQNTSYILGTTEGRMAATMIALGAEASSLFGGAQKMLSAGTEQSVGETVEGDDYSDDYDDTDETTEAETVTATVVSDEPDFPEDPAEKKETRFENLTQSLIEWMEAHRDTLNVETGNGKNPYQLIEAELANPEATEETRAGMIDRIRTWLGKKGIKV